MSPDIDSIKGIRFTGGSIHSLIHQPLGNDVLQNSIVTTFLELMTASVDSDKQ